MTRHPMKLYSLFVLYYLLHILDLYLTGIGMALGAVELNPLAPYGIKYLVLLVTSALLIWLYTERPTACYVGLVALITMYGVVCAWNFGVLVSL